MNSDHNTIITNRFSLLHNLEIANGEGMIPVIINGANTTKGSIMKVEGSIKKDGKLTPKKTKGSVKKTGTPVKTNNNISSKSQKNSLNYWR